MVAGDGIHMGAQDRVSTGCCRHLGSTSAFPLLAPLHSSNKKINIKNKPVGAGGMGELVSWSPTGRQ